MKKATWLLGSEGECHDCGWRPTSWKNAQACAARHAAAAGHRVRVEVYLCSEYDGRGDHGKPGGQRPASRSSASRRPAGDLP